MSELLAEYQDKFSALLDEAVYGTDNRHKSELLLTILNILNQHHTEVCELYRNIFAHHQQSGEQLADLPYLAVRLFKQLKLQSVGDEELFRVLRSSGTTGQTTAYVALDKDTSARQSKVLVKIMQEWIGKQRLPMLIIDCPAVLKDKANFSARGAGIQGLSFFGRDHTYALNDDMSVNWQAISDFEQKYAGKPVLMFGFTFMVWAHFLTALKKEQRKLNFSNSVLLHSGGWKKLESQKVSNQVFKDTVAQWAGVDKVHNFYGMAEQVGSVFVECEHGHLHTPVFAEIIVRNPYTLAPVAFGETGLIQVLSSIPTSYPGHSILTEDMGEVLGVDDCPCGRMGTYFTVHGRLPKTEVRGCSDTQ